jgi:hypothetical protein
MDGLFGLALSPKKSSNFNNNAISGLLNRQNERVLYFHALASGTENAVPLSLINNASIWERDANSEPRGFQVLGRRGVQTAGEWMREKKNWKGINWTFSAQAMDSNGNLFFVLMNPIAVACWDTSLPYSVENIKVVLQNDATLQFASGVKVIKNLLGQEELWVITNRFQVTNSINSIHWWTFSRFFTENR